MVKQTDGMFPEVDLMERQWLAKAVEVLKASLVRSRGKEVMGSEIYALRTKEIATLEALRVKLGGS